MSVTNVFDLIQIRQKRSSNDFATRAEWLLGEIDRLGQEAHYCCDTAIAIRAVTALGELRTIVERIAESATNHEEVQQ